MPGNAFIHQRRHRHRLQAVRVDHRAAARIVPVPRQRAETVICQAVPGRTM